MSTPCVLLGTSLSSIKYLFLLIKKKKRISHVYILLGCLKKEEGGGDGSLLTLNPLSLWWRGKEDIQR